MNPYSLSHVADHVLVHDTKAHTSQVRTSEAVLLAHLAEMEERRLYAPGAYPSMAAYCVGELRMSEDTAFRRIGVARTARRFPAIFPALAAGRLNLTAVLLLTPHLKPHVAPEAADELLTAAAWKTKSEILLLLAERFPRSDVPTLVRAVTALGTSEESSLQLAPERVVPSDPPDAAMLMEPLPPRGKVAPLSPGRFELQTTFNQRVHDKLRYAQSLGGHAVPSGDVNQVLEDALDALIEKREKRVFAACTRTRPRRGAPKGRHVPAEVRRTVWERDGKRCTFHSDTGKRCSATNLLQFDHIEPVARGGQSTAANLRLRCRAHNQFTAEQTFGAGFMKQKREEARCRTANARAEAATRARVEAAAKAMAAADRARHAEVIPWLRSLGFKADEAKRGATMCEGMAGASLEERVRCALAGLGRARFHGATAMARPS